MKADVVLVIALAGVAGTQCSSPTSTSIATDAGGGDDSAESSGGATSGGSSGGSGSDATGSNESGSGGGASSSASGGVDASRESGSGSDGGGSGGDGGGAEDAGGVRCWPGTASFPTFDKHCSAPSDCALAVHTLSCCGNVLVTAINSGAVPAFNDAEATCNSQYPACGCFSNSVTIEDGVAYGNVASPTSAVSAACVSNSCLATFTGPTFPCGDKVCGADVNYCEVQAPTDGAAPSYGCVFVGFPTGDAAIGCGTFAVAPGCTCAESQGHVTVTCS
jgi:hypothetical protein